MSFDFHLLSVDPQGPLFPELCYRLGTLRAKSSNMKVRDDLHACLFYGYIMLYPYLRKENEDEGEEPGC
jgi:hypothetical protein